MKMKVKALLLATSITIATCLLGGCAWQLAPPRDVNIVSYPNRLVYIKGIDTELDHAGGVVSFTDKRGNTTEIAMDDERYGLEKTLYYYIGYISLDKEGVYPFWIEDTEFDCSYPIEVVSLEDIEARLAAKEQKKAGRR